MKQKKSARSYEESIAMSVSVNTVICNLLLSVFKFIAGFVAHSSAMISDAIHSASDVFSTFIVMIGFKISGKAADEDHPYGHERFECVAAIILAIILGATGLFVGYEGIDKILHQNEQKILMPGVLALVAAIISIVTKELMYWYTRSAAKKINSTALMADAWHHRSDALSSIGSLLGIAGSRLGYKLCDPIASVVIAIFIVKVSYSIFKDSINRMTDRSCDKETIEALRKVILGVDGVKGIDLLNSRLFGSKIYVDVEILVDGNLQLIDSHAIAEEVHSQIEANFGQVKHIMVHVNPYIENK